MNEEEAMANALYERAADHVVFEKDFEAGWQAALEWAKQGQEPVAWACTPDVGDWVFLSGSKNPNGKLDGEWYPLYTRPAPAQPVRLSEIDEAIAAGNSVLLNEQAILLRECRRAIDDLLTSKPMLAAKLCGTTTLGNLRAMLYDYRPSGVFGLDSQDAMLAKGAGQPAESISELQKDAVDLLFALQDAWPYVHKWCSVESVRHKISGLIRKYGDFGDIWSASKEQGVMPVAELKVSYSELEGEGFEVLSCELPVGVHKLYAQPAVVQQLVEALEKVLKWDEARKYIMPYKVRDPLRAALKAAKEQT